MSPFLQRLVPWARKIPGLRSAWYLVLELYEFVRRRRSDARHELEALFQEHPDPWHYASSPKEQQRLQRELQTIDALCGPSRIPRALEIGCAEGHFTALLADRCESLTCLDFSPIALSRARKRRRWPDSVNFALFDLYQDAIPGTFDLIVIISVIDYIESPFATMNIRGRLVEALAPGGILVLGNSLCNEVMDNSWWSRLLIRGGYSIARYFAKHPQLEKIHECEMENHLDTVFRKL